jgi:hypothetical protein
VVNCSFLSGASVFGCSFPLLAQKMGSLVYCLPIQFVSPILVVSFPGLLLSIRPLHNAKLDGEMSCRRFFFFFHNLFLIKHRRSIPKQRCDQSGNHSCGCMSCMCRYACMYVCMQVYVCVHVCKRMCACVYVCRCACMQVFVCMCVCMCMYVCMNACMCVCVCMDPCMDACMCVCVYMHVRMYACMHTCMYVCVCVYVCMYVCMCVLL